MSAKLKNSAFSCRLVTAINQIINVLNAAIEQYCLPPLCPSCVLSISGFNYATLAFKDNYLYYKKIYYIITTH